MRTGRRGKTACPRNMPGMRPPVCRTKHSLLEQTLPVADSPEVQKRYAAKIARVGKLPSQEEETAAKRLAAQGGRHMLGQIIDQCPHRGQHAAPTGEDEVDALLQRPPFRGHPHQGPRREPAPGDSQR